MIDYQTALNKILNNIAALDTVFAPLNEASNHVVSENITAPCDVVSFRNSAMDGFAVNSNDLSNLPTALPILATVYAGDMTDIKYKKRSALKIMTGAFVPDNYDTVVKFEDTRYTEDEVTFEQKFEIGQNIRQPGEDLKKGESVLSKNEIIKPIYKGILASLGLTKIPVFRKPKILIFSTGDELVEPGNELRKSQVYNSNNYTINGFIEKYSSEIKIIPPVKDDKEEIKSALNDQYDVIIASGGVSKGDKDFLPEVIEQCGWSTVFHKAAIKPGKPFYCAAKENRHFFGLPGNPLSAAVACAVFVLPALKKMIGLNNHAIPFRNAELLDEPFESNRVVFWPGKIDIKNNKCYCSFSKKRSSSALSALINSDGLIMQEKKDGKPFFSIALWDDIL